MFELFLITILAIITARATIEREAEHIVLPNKLGEKVGGLWQVVNQSMRESKFLKAEKALLTILKIDKKNAAAYNRLGVLYAKQKEFKDAIDCFEIASSIEHSASSLHNLGLIYFETNNYEKAAIAFEQALQLEDNLAARHIAYAKVLEKLGDDRRMLEELERATELEPNPETFTLLAKTYESKGLIKESRQIKKKLQTMVVPAGKTRRVFRPRRVVA